MIKATAENTIFVTVATERTPAAFIVMATARKNDVFVHFLRSEVAPPDYWGMKVKPLDLFGNVKLVCLVNLGQKNLV